MKIKKIKRFLDSSAQISSKLKVTNIHIPGKGKRQGKVEKTQISHTECLAFNVKRKIFYINFLTSHKSKMEIKIL